MYKLADGSTSGQYKIGDKFVVEEESTFSIGSVISFYEEDGSSCPLFRLEDGECFDSCLMEHEGEGAYNSWEFLSKYVQEDSTKELDEEPSLTPFQKAGYTKDTVFRVIDTHRNHSYGTHVTLCNDDGSICPYFIDDEDYVGDYYDIEEELEVVETSKPSGLGTQIDGEHYLEMKMQPVELAYPLGATPCFTKLAKYLTRNKGERIVNLEKALHVIELERDIGVVDMYAQVWGDDVEAVNKVRNHLCEFSNDLYTYNALWAMYLRDYDTAKFWVDKIIAEEQNGKLEN